MPRPVLVIGLSGPTNSGKTTLTRRLIEELPNSYSLCQDHYFLEPGDERLAPLYIPNLNHHNWENFGALEMDKMVEDLEEKISNLQKESTDAPAYIIVEGFCIFDWRPLNTKLDKKYFAAVTKEVCQERRLSRNYNPPDVPGFFQQVVWPMHEKHLESIRSQKEIVYSDCDKSIQNLYVRIREDVKSYEADLDLESTNQNGPMTAV